MQIERVSVDSLHYDPSNARKHSRRNLDAIKGSLAKFGQQKPIVVTAENIVIAGNGTLEAAKEIGWTDINIYRTPLSGTEAIAFALADNRTAELADWEDGILQEQVVALHDDGFEIEGIGFDLKDFGIGVEPGDLPDAFADGERPLQQMTFIVNVEEQKPVVDEAIRLAAKGASFDEHINSNGNGNALHRICAEWLQQNQ